MNVKKKGNRFENIIAKKLSQWMYGDKISLIRSITSGALKDDKAVFNGDIIPITSKRDEFPFLIECKTGYAKSIPDIFLQSQTLIRKWINKAIEDCTADQKKILLIIKFNRRKTLLLTNILSKNFNYYLILKEKNFLFYVYNFDELIKTDFTLFHEKI